MPNTLVNRAGFTVIVTDGKTTRRMVCNSRHAADALAERLRSDRALAISWLKGIEYVQLEMNFESTDDHRILESKD